MIPPVARALTLEREQFKLEESETHKDFGEPTGALAVEKKKSAAD